MQTEEMSLAAILESEAIRNDMIARRILQDLRSCQSSDDVIVILKRLSRRIEDIHAEMKSRKSIINNSAGSRTNILI